MIITRKAIPRRTVLHGIGAALALPLLDGMVPALTAQARTAAKPIHRFGVIIAGGEPVPVAVGPGKDHFREIEAASIDGHP